MVTSVKQIRWLDVDPNCKKKVAEYLYDVARGTYGTVMISKREFSEMWTNELIEGISTVVEEFYGAVGVSCGSLEESSIMAFYSSDVAPIVA